MNNNKNLVSTSVRYLAAGDVMTGSGFTVARQPYSSVRCPKGRLHVEGNYPGSEVKVYTMNASTTVTVAR